MSNMVLAWIGTDSCEPGQELLTTLAPIVGVLVLVASTIGLWIIYKDSNKSALSTSDRALNLVLFIVGLGLAAGAAFVAWFILAISGACSG